MKRHRIFAKGEQIHVLLSSHKYPNILIPVKAIIRDALWDDVNPQYQVKITKFYDTLVFLKRYLFDMNFNNQIGKRARRFRLNDENFNSVRDLENRLNEHDEARYYVVVDSIMTTKTKGDMKKLFNNIQFFLISRKLKECRELMTRSFFSGTLRLDSKKEFGIRFKKFASDKFEDAQEDIDRYLNSL